MEEDSMFLAKIHQSYGKFSGMRVIRSAEFIPSRVKFRVILANGQKVFVEDVEIIKEVEEKKNDAFGNVS